MTMQWNLLCRSVSVEDLMLEHITWQEDAMRVIFSKTKSDQTGEGISNDKFIYSNVINPTVDPILALGVYIFCKQRNSQNGCNYPLFEGNDQKARFSKILHDVVGFIPDTYDLGNIIWLMDIKVT